METSSPYAHSYTQPQPLGCVCLLEKFRILHVSSLTVALTELCALFLVLLSVASTSSCGWLIIPAGYLMTNRAYALMPWIILLPFSWFLSTCLTFWRYLAAADLCVSLCHNQSCPGENNVFSFAGEVACLTIKENKSVTYASHNTHTHTHTITTGEVERPR